MHRSTPASATVRLLRLWCLAVLLALAAPGVLAQQEIVEGEPAPAEGVRPTDPTVGAMTPEELIGMRVTEPDGRRLGAVADVVRDRDTGRLQLLVSNRRVEQVALRYAPIPIDQFRRVGTHLQLTRRLPDARFRASAREFHAQASRFEPVAELQISLLEPEAPPRG